MRLRERLHRGIAVAKHFAQLAFKVALVFITLLAALLSLIAWHIRKEAIVLVLVAAAIGGLYLKTKHDQIIQSLDSLNFENEVTSRTEALSDRIVQKVVDTLSAVALTSAEETLNVVSAAVALIGAFLYIVGLHVAGIITIIFAVILFTASCFAFACLRSIVRTAVQSTISSILRKRESPPQRNDNEQTPLVD